jgi:hypothetical protein
VAIVVIGGAWFGLSRGSGPTVASTVADCSQGIEGPNAQPVTSLQPGVVGLGSVASIATFTTSTGPLWCFDDMSLGTGGITNAQMRSALAAPVAIEDGNNLTSDVLLLVHLGKSTTSVVVTTADTRSSVLARKDGFEVLRIPTTGWPISSWHAPWPRRAVALGRIVGFDNEGRVTASMPFTWCPGGVNNFPGKGC